MRPVKGINKDADERSQPEGTYRNALNASLDEEVGVLRREKGLEEAGQFTDYTVQGHIILDNGNVIFFLYDSDATAGEVSKIVEWDPVSNSVVKSIKDGDIDTGVLDFQHSIQAVYRKLETGNTVIYWTDGVNPPRFINLDQPVPNNIEDLDLFSKISSGVEFDLENVRSFGGSLKGGVYQLAIAYVGEDQSVTNYFYVSNPIPINSRSGFGEDSDDTTSKSIRFSLSGIDESYDFVRIAAIKGTQVQILPDVSVTSDELTYTFTGDENSTDGSLEDIIVNNARYKSAEVMEAHEGTLYMANLEKDEIVDFQKHTNDITLEAITKPVSELSDASDPIFAFTKPDASKYSTYKRGETYAFYITYMLKDGSETPAFHIPGLGNTDAGSSSLEPYESQIVVNSDFPTPSEGTATGDIEGDISPSTLSKASHRAIEVQSGAGVTVNFDVVYIDDTGSVVSTINIGLAAPTKKEIVDEIKTKLNNNSSFSSDFTASTLSSPNESFVVIDANVAGSQWNGYDVRIVNMNNTIVDYTNRSGTTSGGEDETDPPDRDITVDWETGSVTVTVSISAGLTKADSIDEYITALQGNTTFTDDFSVVDNGEDMTITADSNGTDYNATVIIEETGGGEVFQEVLLDGGWTTGDTISLEVKLSPGTSWTEITGIAAGETKNNVASAIHTELDNNGPAGFIYTVSDNKVTIKDDNDRDLADESPDIRSSFNLGISTTLYLRGGSTIGLGEATIEFTGPAPTPPASNSEGVLDSIQPIPSNPGDKAEGDLVNVLSGADTETNFDIVLYDSSDNVVTSVSDTVSSGTTQDQVVSSIVGALENAVGAPQDFTATVNGQYVHLKADNVGTQYNGHYIRLENFSDFGAFLFDTPNVTSGGEDSGGVYGDHEIVTSWDSDGESTTVNVTLNHSDTAIQVAGKYTTALNNDTTWSSNYTATDNGDGTITIVADTASSVYNGDIVVNNLVTGQDTIDFANLTGGTDGSEDLSLTIRPGTFAAATTVNVSPGVSKETVALESYEALSNNSNYQDQLFFEVNNSVVTLIDQTADPNINGEIPSISSSFSISYSVTEWEGSGFSGGGSTNETIQNLLQPLPTGHPLKGYDSEVSGTLRKFHVDAPIVDNGFSYWQQEGEIYPDIDRWDIIAEDGSSNGTLRNKKVRHHRFPDVDENPHVNDNPDSGEADLFVYGIKVKNVHVPSSMEEDVIGYKIYYARKETGNRLILDQSTGIHGWLDAGNRTRYSQQNNNVFNSNIWSAHGFEPITDFNGDGSSHTWDTDRTLLQLHPFELLRTGTGVQGVTHVKIVGTIGKRDSQDKWDIFQKKNTIHNVKAISYIDQNQREVSLDRLGFTRDYDNLFGESKVIVELEESIPNDIPICDLCQLKTNIHRPFDNQELVSTGFIGDIDQTDGNEPIIYGGDINIEPWYYKANTVLALAEKDAWTGSDEDNDWFGRDDGPQEIGDSLLFGVKDELFGSNINKDERNGFANTIEALIGNTGNINSLPIAWGTRWFDLVETRDHPWFRTPGEDKIEDFYPSADFYVVEPNLSDLPTEFNDISDSTDKAAAKTRWIFQFFLQSDNWLDYNEEYSKENVVDAAFPFKTAETGANNFPTRVIRSAKVQERGERSAWRTFLAEDYIDLPKDKGEVTNIAPSQSNLLIHSTEALFITRADQRIKTTADSAFIGSGNLFNPLPKEIISIDQGYGGLLDHRSAHTFEGGYVFVDQEAGKVFLFSNGIQDLSQNGMRKFFRDNLVSSSIPRVGYDPYTGRIFVSDKDQDWTYSFHPGVEAWVSEHSFKADYYFTTREHLYSVIEDTIHRVSTGSVGQYEGVNKPFEIDYVQHTPRPDSKIIVSLIIDSKVLESGTEISEETFDQFRVWNSYQDTGLTGIREKVSQNGSLKTNSNARLIDQAWKINEIRDNPSHPQLNSNRTWKYQRRMSDNVHRIKLIYNKPNRVIELFSSALLTRNSRR